MKCLKCKSVQHKVIDSKLNKSERYVRRRRECLECGFRWFTIEVDEKYFEYLNYMGEVKKGG